MQDGSSSCGSAVHVIESEVIPIPPLLQFHHSSETRDPSGFLSQGLFLANRVSEAIVKGDASRVSTAFVIHSGKVNYPCEPKKSTVAPDGENSGFRFANPKK
jgi:hypothetical protein